MRKRNLILGGSLASLIGLGIGGYAIHRHNEAAAIRASYVPITGTVRLDPSFNVPLNHQSLSVAEVAFWLQTDYGLKSFRCSEYSDKERVGLENAAMKLPQPLSKASQKIKLGSGLETRLRTFLQEHDGKQITLMVPQNMAQAISRPNASPYETKLQKVIQGQSVDVEWFSIPLPAEYITGLK